MGNLHKLRGVHGRCIKYNIVDPLKVPTMVDEVTTDPSFRWGGKTTKRDMLVHWYQINLADTIKFKRDTKSFVLEEDMASSDLVKDLLTNLSDAELKQQVNENSEKLDPVEQGGIT